MFIVLVFDVLAAVATSDSDKSMIATRPKVIKKKR